MLLSQSVNANYQSKVIYGEDNRLDYYESTKNMQTLADSTVGLVDYRDLTESNGKFILKTQNYSKRMNLCPSERFYDQLSGPWCSGFLIGPNTMVTAGHCITSQSACEKVAFVFGFNKQNSVETTTSFNAEDIYRCKTVLHRDQDNFGADYAIVSLDRETTRTPLKLASELPGTSTELVVIGHPSGLPTKISAGAFIRNSNTGFFNANTDTYGGNSGSAVLNVLTGEVQGILVRGETDFVWEGNCRVSKKCPEYACRGEDITDIAEVIKKLSTL
jgi:hypothetical protein